MKRPAPWACRCCAATTLYQARYHNFATMPQSLSLPPHVSSRHLGRAVRDIVDRAAAADIVEMGIEEAAGGALAALVQALEEVEVVVEPAVRVESLAGVAHHDAMQPDAAAIAVAGAARQPPLIGQLVDELDRAQLGRLCGIEGNLVGAARDLAGADRHLVAFARVDLHDQQ